MADVKETKEALVAAVALAKAIAKVVKDGVDIADAVAIMSDPEVKATMPAAVAGISAVPAEIKDISLMEGAELVVALLEELKK